MTTPVDVDRWTHRQRALDAEATHSLPTLLALKQERILVSPHALFRGSARLFYELLIAHGLRDGPEGEGWIVGDMHLENVGAFRTERGDVVFDLNDFDEATVAPLWLDVVRAMTSVLLCGRAFRCSGPRAIALARALLQSYLRACFGRVSRVRLARPIAELVRVVEARSYKSYINARAPADKRGRRRLLHGKHNIQALPRALRALPEELLARYLETLGDRLPSRDVSLADAALRVAGTGSLGSVRVALLVHEHGAADRIFEAKEVKPSVVDEVFQPTREQALDPAARLCAAATALVQKPPRLLAPIGRVEGHWFIGRRLAPQEDKLDLAQVADEDLPGVVQSVGHVLGRAHARAATQLPRRRWSGADQEWLLGRAVDFAGVFEAVYLRLALELDGGSTRSLSSR